MLGWAAAAFCLCPPLATLATSCLRNASRGSERLFFSLCGRAKHQPLAHSQAVCCRKVARVTLETGTLQRLFLHLSLSFCVCSSLLWGLLFLQGAVTLGITSFFFFFDVLTWKRLMYCRTFFRSPKTALLNQAAKISVFEIEMYPDHCDVIH